MNWSRLNTCDLLDKYRYLIFELRNRNQWLVGALFRPIYIYFYTSTSLCYRQNSLYFYSNHIMSHLNYNFVLYFRWRNDLNCLRNVFNYRFEMKTFQEFYFFQVNQIFLNITKNEIRIYFKLQLNTKHNLRFDSDIS